MCGAPDRKHASDLAGRHGRAPDALTRESQAAPSPSRFATPRDRRQELVLRLLVGAEQRSGLCVTQSAAEKLLRIFAPVGLGEFEAAVARLESLPASDPEWLALIESLTVHETCIMRERAPARVFRETAAQYDRTRHQGFAAPAVLVSRLRLGEEAYSIAALALDALAKAGKAAVTEDGLKLLPPWQLEIIGADIPAAPWRGRRRASRDRTALVLRTPKRRRCCIISRLLTAANGRSASPMRAATPALKRVVRFSQFNVVADAAPPEPFDAVFCRNVFIYFSERARREAQQKLAGTVQPGGCSCSALPTR